jgi:cell wall-associated NlpC family hydrolase
MRRLPITLLLACALVGRLQAQDGVMLSAGYLLAGSPDESTWRLTVQRALLGPIGVDLSGSVLPGERPGAGGLFGVGLDFTLFDGGRRLPAVFIGGVAGVGFKDQEAVWYGSSIGIRQPLFTVASVRSTIEGRWRNSTIAGRDGIELAVTLGWRRGPRSGVRPSEGAGLYVPRRTGERLRAAGIPSAKADLLDNVVGTALEEMGQPYVWGGTGDGSGGFDCSGLIYYAYGRHGVRIPRTSQGQAGAGIAIRRDLDALLPGDILTFAEDGGQVSHVGLYVGEGRFIHSASSGVRLSRLAEDDPNGRYWLRRWVGVRRVVE